MLRPNMTLSISARLMMIWWRPEHQTCQRADDRQEDRFAEDIGTDLVVVEAQHLDRRDLPDPLGDVDIGQIIEDDKSQQAGCDDQHDDDKVQRGNRIIKCGS